ncbi:hypothetical protein [Paenibacillus sp. FSL H8-0537]|uniref:hypothetical protein n=1 Tax=Paenibacillus sp. FSL H8-0537 TaxID=2921399 RepID=UPI003100F22D
MKSLFRNIALSLSLVIMVNLLLTAGVSAQNVEDRTVKLNNSALHDEFEREMLRALQANALENQMNAETSFYQKSNAEPMVVGVILHLLKLVFKDAIKTTASVTVKTTAKNITTKLTYHSMVRAVERNVTSAALDNLLSEISSGIKLVQKYDDLDFDSRVMYDPNNKLVVILEKNSNTVISTYTETGNAIETRISNGRLKKATWIFK